MGVFVFTGKCLVPRFLLRQRPDKAIRIPVLLQMQYRLLSLPASGQIRCR